MWHNTMFVWAEWAYRQRRPRRRYNLKWRPIFNLNANHDVNRFQFRNSSKTTVVLQYYVAEMMAIKEKYDEMFWRWFMAGSRANRLLSSLLQEFKVVSVSAQQPADRRQTASNHTVKPSQTEGEQTEWWKRKRYRCDTNVSFGVTEGIFMSSHAGSIIYLT